MPTPLARAFYLNNIEIENRIRGHTRGKKRGTSIKCTREGR